jgi:hypothetical protein
MVGGVIAYRLANDGPAGHSKITYDSGPITVGIMYAIDIHAATLKRA